MKKNVEKYLATGHDFRNREKYLQAASAYKKAIKADPGHADAWFYLGRNYKMQGNIKEAVKAYQEAVSLDPNRAEFYHHLGISMNLQGDAEGAAEAFQCASSLDPDNEISKHMLASVMELSPDKAPERYVSNLFDQYACQFDNHLKKRLECRIPRLIRNAVLTAAGRNHCFQNVFDMGCGTGLAGEELRRSSCRITGVDLSEKMVLKAKEKNIYDRLVVSEIIDYLNTSSERFDLFVSSDVFGYIGKLEPVFLSIDKSAMPGALFCFSTESTYKKDYILQRSGRFAHRRSYIEKLSGMIGADIKSIQMKKLRKERRKWIHGFIVVIRL